MKGSDFMKDNKGSTMIEVIVGFTLLMIILSSLTHIIDVSSELFFKSKDMIVKENSFEKNKQKKDAQYNEASDLELSLCIDEEKTDASNLAADINIKLNNIKCLIYEDEETKFKSYKVERK